MHHEQLALERQNMLDEINKLKSQLKAIESDFAQCARGTSACFFCTKDDSCDCVDDKKCAFVWAKHN